MRMIRTLLTVSHLMHCAALNPENVGLKGIVCHFVEFVTRLDCFHFNVEEISGNMEAV